MNYKSKSNGYPLTRSATLFLLFVVSVSTQFPFETTEDNFLSNDLYAFSSADSDTFVNYFPLNIGDYHIYETRYFDRDPPWFNNTNVLDTISINSNFYYQVQTYWHGSLRLRMDEIGDIYAYSVEDSQDVLLYGFNIALGDSYRVDSLAYGFPYDVTVTGINKTTETPAGIFNDCVTLFFDNPEVTDEAVDIWFAPDVGIVRVDGPFHLQSILKSAIVDTVLYGNESPIITLPDILYMNYQKTDTLVLSDYVTDRESPDSLLEWEQYACIGADSILCVLVFADTALFIPVNYWGNSEVEFIVFDPAGASDTSSMVVSVKGPVGIEQIDSNIPAKHSLSQNHPNPFNPVTNISYSLSVSGDVSLIIYNLLGKEVARLVDGFQQAGEYTTVWNASHVSSGIYFYRLRSGEFTETKKMVLLK